MTALIGSIAALLTTAAFLPQAIKIIQTGSTKDLSLAMFSMLVVGTFLWLLYGIRLNEMPLILANLVSCLINSVILAYKIKHTLHGEKNNE